MNLNAGSLARKALLASAAAASATVLMSSPAMAAVDDGFIVRTTDGCGQADYVDYGPGAPGGGNNDDYIVLHDYCADGHGTKVYAWLNGIYLGSKYNGNGQAGAAVVWDPYQPYGNVKAGDRVELQVCLVDGASDTTGVRCSNLGTRTSTDG